MGLPNCTLSLAYFTEASKAAWAIPIDVSPMPHLGNVMSAVNGENWLRRRIIPSDSGRSSISLGFEKALPIIALISFSFETLQSSKNISPVGAAFHPILCSSFVSNGDTSFSNRKKDSVPVLRSFAPT